MGDRWMLMFMITLFMLCEKVECRIERDSAPEYGDVVVAIFEIAVIVVLVMCCVGMFQQYDGMEYFGWTAAQLPPPQEPPRHEGCGSVRITMDDLRRVVSKEVKQEMKKAQGHKLMTVLEEGYASEL